MSKKIELACDILVAGAGPAGIAAAVSAAESGARVIIVDDNLFPGGQIWRAATGEAVHTAPHSRDAEHRIGRLRECGATLLSSTRVVARLAEGLVLAESESEAIEIRFRRVILATGARELVLPFPGWTLPNVFAAGGLQALVKSGFPVREKRIVVAGTGPLLLAVAAFLKSHGAVIEGVFEQSPWARVVRFACSLIARPAMLWSGLGYGARLLGSPYRCGWWPVSAHGFDRVNSLTVTDGSRVMTIDCDLVACGFHLVPNTELQSGFGCALTEGGVKVDESQETSVSDVFSVGETTGIGGVELALAEGEIAGLVAAGKMDRAIPLIGKRRLLARMAQAMDRAFALRPELRDLPKPDTVVCRCEDVRWSALGRERSLRAAKLHTRCGMGPCQGRICGAALHFLSGWRNESVRPPVYPVRLSTLIREAQALTKEMQ